MAWRLGRCARECPTARRGVAGVHRTSDFGLWMQWLEARRNLEWLRAHPEAPEVIARIHGLAAFRKRYREALRWEREFAAEAYAELVRRSERLTFHGAT